jgi:hypothetical protein
LTVHEGHKLHGVLLIQSVILFPSAQVNEQLKAPSLGQTVAFFSAMGMAAQFTKLKVSLLPKIMIKMPKKP